MWLSSLCPCFMAPRVPEGYVEAPPDDGGGVTGPLTISRDDLPDVSVKGDIREYEGVSFEGIGMRSLSAVEELGGAILKEGGIWSLAEGEVVLPGSEAQRGLADMTKGFVDEGGGEECVICMESITEGDPKMLTLCNCGMNKTTFHYVCLLNWVERDSSCPACRSELIWQEAEVQIGGFEGDSEGEGNGHGQTERYGDERFVSEGHASALEEDLSKEDDDEYDSNQCH